MTTFRWIDDGPIQRCDFQHPVAVKLRAWRGGEPELTTIKHAGYIVRVAPLWAANTYGSANPDSYEKEFDNIDEAKAYVEQQALLGIVINKLTR